MSEVIEFTVRLEKNPNVFVSGNVCIHDEDATDVDWNYYDPQGLERPQMFIEHIGIDGFKGATYQQESEINEFKNIYLENIDVINDVILQSDEDDTFFTVRNGLIIEVGDFDSTIEGVFGDISSYPVTTDKPVKVGDVVTIVNSNCEFNMENHNGVFVNDELPFTTLVELSPINMDLEAYIPSKSNNGGAYGYLTCRVTKILDGSDKKTTIQVHQSTKDALAKIGDKNDSYEDIILRLLDQQ